MVFITFICYVRYRFVSKFSYDVDNIMAYLRKDYEFSLNSPDKFYLSLPMTKSKAYGGTMLLWKRELDPYVTLYPPTSCAALPIIFEPPGTGKSVHVCVYLPTCGRDLEFIEELTKLAVLIQQLSIDIPNVPLFIRGDFNTSEKNRSRSALFESFKRAENLSEVEFDHLTYHHFVGNGSSDSKLDRILFSHGTEVLKTIVCKHENPFVESHHDVLVSEWMVPKETAIPPCTSSSTVPTIPNMRHRILWTDDGIVDYQKLIIPHLNRLSQLWLTPSPSRNCLSIVLDATNVILTECAKATNKSFSLKPKPGTCSKSTPRPRAIKISGRKLLRQWKYLKYVRLSKNISDVSKLDYEKKYSEAKRAHRKLSRNLRAKNLLDRDANLLSNPAATYASIRKARRARNGSLQKLTFNSKVYHNEAVKDGFFESIKELKSKDPERLANGSHYSDFLSDYAHIVELCKNGTPILQITESKALSLLYRLKPHVPDLYSVTPAHYMHAGPIGWRYFHCLLNSLISEISNVSITEVNQAYACILFKGHEKDKSSSRSYRTISTCPVVAKALDLHIRDLQLKNWNENQANTQFQGQGSSHELAALLLSECIQHSLYTLKQPLFVLYLDARSAFDLVQREILIHSLYHAQDQDQSILYIDKRLQCRQTMLDWNGCLMGPISDEQGVEQGGCNSSEFYKIFGREQLTLAQKSGLGTKLGSLNVAAIGQADDTALISNDIFNLQYLLKLSNVFCHKYLVEQCAEKNKLQVYTKKGIAYDQSYTDLVNPIIVNEKQINFSSEAEHVGLLRSTYGNGPTISARFSAHRKALAGLLHTGLARGHRANPTQTIKIEKLYALPVLLSGLGSLILSIKEVDMIERHFRETLRCLLRLHERTPKCVVYFLAGCLPGSALIHLRQLSLFNMIIRLPNNILHHHATNLFSARTISPRSWFAQIRDLCLKYGLPHPGVLLKSPPSKSDFKAMAKKKVIDFWEIELREQAKCLKSLKYFYPEFMSLTVTHPMFSTAGAFPRKVSMATVQAVMISGRYRCDALLQHWSQKVSGVCTQPSCTGSFIVDDIEHILRVCPSLQPMRQKLEKFTHGYLVNNQLPDDIISLVKSHCTPIYPDFCRFLIDCSSLPSVIRAEQIFGIDVLHHIFTITRTWIYTLHRERLKLRGEWKLCSA